MQSCNILKISDITDDKFANGAIEPLKTASTSDKSSAKLYFHCYGQLLRQQNMLQDYVRTGILP